MLEKTGNFLFCFFVTLICVFLSCSDNGVSEGGGGIDIGNPTKICVTDSFNRPVSGASVRVIQSEKWFTSIFNGEYPPSISSLTGASGYVVFDSISEGIYNLQIDHSSGGAFLKNMILEGSQEVKTVVIRDYGAVSGKISVDSAVPVKITLAGTAYGTQVNNDGTYTLTNIPQGLFFPLVMTSDSQWIFAGEVNVMTAQIAVCTSNIVTKRLLIEDFEDSASTMRMSRFIRSGYIYSNKSNSSGGSVQYQIVQDGVEGNALEATLVRKGMWALVGFYLGVKEIGDSTWDLHLAKGITFYARGNGKLNISLESDSIEKMGYFKHYSADIVLKPQWQLFSISLDTLKFFADANPEPDLPWEVAAQSIKRIEFNALEGDTVQLWLDELTVEGVNISDVY